MAAETLEIGEYVLDTKTARGRRRYVLLMHGIRGYGDWYRVLYSLSEKYSYRFEPIEIRYGRISTFFFLLGLFRAKAFRNAARQINAHFDAHECDQRCDIICHSNGTKVLAEATHLISGKFNSIVFLGSVCKSDDALGLRRICDRMLNHAGTRDYLPYIAETLRSDLFEQTGRIGITNGFAINRYFDIDHSECVSESHIEKYIVPYIISNKIKGGTSLRPTSNLINPDYTRRLLFTIFVAIAIIVFIIHSS